MFGPLSLILVLILFFSISTGIYRNQMSGPSESGHRFRISGYLLWFLRLTGQGLRRLFSRSEGSLIRTWRRLPLSGFEKGILGFLGFSFLYLALSGLISVWWPERVLHGLFLVLHMLFGGIFAAAMTVSILRWTRYFIAGVGPDHHPTGRRLLFWLFSWSGLLLILSALGMMLPLFTTFDQPVLLSLHRYAGLASILSGTLLAYRLLTASDHAGP